MHPTSKSEITDSIELHPEVMPPQPRRDIYIPNSKQWWWLEGVITLEDKQHPLKISASLTSCTIRGHNLKTTDVTRNSIVYNHYPDKVPSGKLDFNEHGIRYQFRLSTGELDVKVTWRDIPLWYGFSTAKDDMMHWTTKPNSYFGGFDVIANIEGTQDNVPFTGIALFERSWVGINKEDLPSIDRNKMYSWNVYFNNRIGIITIDSKNPKTDTVLIKTGRLTRDNETLRCDDFTLESKTDNHKATITTIEGQPIGEFIIGDRPDTENHKPYKWTGEILGETMSGIGFYEWKRPNSQNDGIPYLAAILFIIFLVLLGIGLKFWR